ncbi:MAG: serine/threonine-protein kinase [Kofleriaceae bacterium]
MGCATTDTLARFERGELSIDERGVILDHAAGCESCHAAITVLSATPAPVTQLSATAPVDPPPLSPEGRIGRYTLGRVIGRGAMGVVHVANDPELGRDVALKILRPRASPERLRREAKALAKLAHPNVVRVYDIGEDAGQIFIAMELVEGENLREWLASPRSLDETLAVLVAAGRGLAAAHAVGLVHRDFKPDNVLVAQRGDVLVGDFGLAQISPPGSQDGPTASSAVTISSIPEADSENDAALTATGTVVGTPAYMAPEQMHGDALAASDQYAFCVTAWEALFGRRPYDGVTVAELRANARAKRIVRPERDVPRSVEKVLRRGLEESASARFPSMDALLAALAPSRGPRRAWIAFGGLAVALGGAGAVWFATREPAIDCGAAAALIAPAWGPHVEGVLRGRLGDRIASSYDVYAGNWQEARVEACAATHVRREQSTATLERRVGCLDRARAALHTTVSMLVSSGETLARPDVVAESLPALERCDAAQASAPPPVANQAQIATVEAELTELEVNLAGGDSSLSLAETVAIRERAEKLGYTPTTLRARMLEARVATWTGDRSAAEAILRDVMVEAERANDDAARAFASALLASLVADDHTNEAAQLVAGGRAALARAGGDLQIDEALLAAEVEIMEARGDLRGAAALQEKLVARIEARLPTPTQTTSGAYNRLGRLWGLVPDYDKSRAAYARVYDLAAIHEPDTDPEKLFRTFPLQLATSGDFDGAVALGQRQLAYLRSLPDPPKLLLAQILDSVGNIHEWDLDYARCIEVHRESEKAWSLPLDAYRTPNVAPNEVTIVNGRIDAIFGIAACLFKQGRFTAALPELRRAHALAVAGGTLTAEQIPSLERMLGVTLVETGDARAARSHLEPLVTGLADGAMAPVSRALLRFGLARALWLDGGTSDRPRARALAEDALRDLDELTTEEMTGAMRKLPILRRERRAAIEKWLAEHRL